MNQALPYKNIVPLSERIYLFFNFNKTFLHYSNLGQQRFLLKKFKQIKPTFIF